MILSSLRLLKEESYNLNENDQSILNEEYFGKKTNFNKIDNCFDQLIKLAKMNTNNGLGRYSDGKEKEFYKKSAPIVLEIGKYVKDEFNFKNVAVDIINTANPNVITIKRTDIIRRSKEIQNTTEVTKNGIRFKDGKFPAIFIISREVFDIEGIEGKHLTAILLHEIAHQFYYENTLQYKLNLSYLIKSTIDIGVNGGQQGPFIIGSFIGLGLAQLLNPTTILNNLTKLFNNASQKENGIMKSFIGSYCNTLNNIRGISDSINIFMGIANAKLIIPSTRGVGGIIKKGVFSIFRDPGFTEEQFADNFATSYGYGKEFITAMTLLTNRLDNIFSKNIQKNKGMGTIYNSLRDFDYMLFGSSDVHPNVIARLLDQIKYMEIQVENEKNHPMYNQMKADLANMKKEYELMLNELISFEKDSDIISRGKVFAAIGNNIKYVFGGGIQYNSNKKAYDKSGKLNALKR